MSSQSTSTNPFLWVDWLDPWVVPFLEKSAAIE